MVKTFEICAPSLNGGESALGDVKAFFSDKEFPLNVQVSNHCPFPLIVPNLRCQLDAGESGECVARSIEELLRFIVSVEQIAFLNNVSSPCKLCYSDATVIEEPVTEEKHEDEPVEQVTSMRKPRRKRTN